MSDPQRQITVFVSTVTIYPKKASPQKDNYAKTCIVNKDISHACAVAQITLLQICNRSKKTGFSEGIALA
jgi:hypothetical protein